MEDSSKDLSLVIITVLTITMVVVGVTFAYFTTKMNGTNGSVNLSTMKVGNIVRDEKTGRYRNPHK